MHPRTNLSPINPCVEHYFIIKMQYTNFIKKLFVLFALVNLWGAGHVLAEEDTELEVIPSKLLEAVVADDLLGIRQALRDGSSIDTTNVNGWSAAIFAVTSGHIRSLHAVVDAGIDLNQANNEGKTPLMYAAQQGDKEIVEVLLAGNADPAHENADGVSAYDLASDRCVRSACPACHVCPMRCKH